MNQTEALRKNGWLAATTVAEKLGRNISTIYRRIESGALEGQVIDGHWYVKMKSLEKSLGKEGLLALGIDLRKED